MLITGSICNLRRLITGCYLRVIKCAIIERPLPFSILSSPFFNHHRHRQHCLHRHHHHHCHRCRLA